MVAVKTSPVVQVVYVIYAGRPLLLLTMPSWWSHDLVGQHGATAGVVVV